MARPPRDQQKDRLASHTLIYQSYGQIGIMEVSCFFFFFFLLVVVFKSRLSHPTLQSAAGFLTYFVVMGENGFLPWSLVGIRAQWEKKDVYVMDSYGQEWVRTHKGLWIVSAFNL